MSMKYTDQPFVEARRALRHLVRVHRDDIEAEHAFYAAEHRIDYGEFASPPDPTYGISGTLTEDKLLEAVSRAFGYPPEQLSDIIGFLDDMQHDIDSPGCPYMERGVTCRNGAIMGVDDDGEPYGRDECGCDQRDQRAQAIERLNERRPWRQHRGVA